MKWFEEVFFPSLVERYNEKGAFKLSDRQEMICRRYMKGTKHPDFFLEHKGYGVYQVAYSHKNRMSWKNGFWFERII